MPAVHWQTVASWDCDGTWWSVQDAGCLAQARWLQHRTSVVTVDRSTAFAVQRRLAGWIDGMFGAHDALLCK
jgi:hypothetical protein